MERQQTALGWSSVLQFCRCLLENVWKVPASWLRSALIGNTVFSENKRPSLIVLWLAVLPVREFEGAVRCCCITILDEKSSKAKVSHVQSVSQVGSSLRFLSFNRDRSSFTCWKTAGCWRIGWPGAWRQQQLPVTSGRPMAVRSIHSQFDCQL